MDGDFSTFTDLPKMVQNSSIDRTIPSFVSDGP